jgi:hypothetical protein
LPQGLHDLFGHSVWSRQLSQARLVARTRLLQQAQQWSLLVTTQSASLLHVTSPMLAFVSGTPCVGSALGAAARGPSAATCAAGVSAHAKAKHGQRSGIYRTQTA